MYNVCYINFTFSVTIPDLNELIKNQTDPALMERRHEILTWILMGDDASIKLTKTDELPTGYVVVILTLIYLLHVIYIHIV